MKAYSLLVNSREIRAGLLYFIGICTRQEVRCTAAAAVRQGRAAARQGPALQHCRCCCGQTRPLPHRDKAAAAARKASAAARQGRCSIAPVVGA